MPQTKEVANNKTVLAQNPYQHAWESFWSSLTGEPGEVLWNVSPTLGAGLDFRRFQNLFATNKLPLVDVGCGDGSQTCFFAEHVARLIGVDVSASAIKLARLKNAGLEFQVLDLLDKAACQAFHGNLGDANIYMRGVMLQFEPKDRLRAADNLNVLMGNEGYLYLSEYLPEKAYYTALIEAQGLPRGFAQIRKHGIVPGGIAQEDLSQLFPADQFETVLAGDHVMHTVIPLVAGGFAQAPAFYRVFKRLWRKQ